MYSQPGEEGRVVFCHELVFLCSDKGHTSLRWPGSGQAPESCLGPLHLSVGRGSLCRLPLATLVISDFTSPAPRPLPACSPRDSSSFLGEGHRAGCILPEKPHLRSQRLAWACCVQGSLPSRLSRAFSARLTRLLSTSALFRLHPRIDPFCF